jgi:hypothetical protein
VRIGAALAVLLVAAAGSGGEAPAYTVKMQPGVTPRRTAAEIAALARGRVVEVECNDGKAHRNAYSHPERRDGGPIWIVRTATRSGCVRSLFVDDETLEVLGSGQRGCGPPASYIDVEKLRKEP